MHMLLFLRTIFRRSQSADAIPFGPPQLLRSLSSSLVGFPPLCAGGEHEGLFSRTTCEAASGRVRLSGTTLRLKRLVSRQIIAVKA
jgi:hypothetical protein